MSETSSTENELRAIAAQLAHPAGEAGIAMGHTMNRSNNGMVLRTIEALGAMDGDNILELGHGHCAHLGNLLGPLLDATYHGLEISHTMHEASRQQNNVLIEDGRAHFALYDGRTIPAPDATFTKAFTVNTLYFWDDPAALLRELYRVLVPGGRLCVAFADRAFMQQLPFTPFGFTLYDPTTFQELVASTAFGAAAFCTHRERTISKDGQELERTYHIATLTK